MKKRILSLVLCAALLLSLCLFMGAPVLWTMPLMPRPRAPPQPKSKRLRQLCIRRPARSCPLFRCSQFCVLCAPAVQMNSRTA